MTLTVFTNFLAKDSIPFLQMPLVTEYQTAQSRLAVLETNTARRHIQQTAAVKPTAAAMESGEGLYCLWDTAVFP